MLSHSLRQFFDRAAVHPAQAYFLIGTEGMGVAKVGESVVRQLLQMDERRSLALHPDAVLLIPDEGKSQISAEAARQVRECVSLRPTIAPRVVVFLPDTSTLGEAGANALLKVMEEPSAGAVFVLCGRAADDVPATIRSRSVVVSIPPMRKEEMIQQLEARGLSKTEATATATAARGRPEWIDQNPRATWNELAEAFVSDSNPGKRLEVIERVVQKCESGSAESSWRTWFEAVSRAWAERSKQDADSLWLGHGIAGAWKMVGTAVSPRWVLEQAILKPGILDQRIFSVCISKHIPGLQRSWS